MILLHHYNHYFKLWMLVFYLNYVDICIFSKILIAKNVIIAMLPFLFDK